MRVGSKVKKALITGITGQDGSYLARLLLAKGYEVTGTVRANSQAKLTRLRKLGVADDVRLVDFDLSEINSINRVLRQITFDEVYNLAAQSFVGSSWDQPLYVADVNGMGVARLLDAIRTYCPQTRFYQASTSEMFGRARAVPQNEETPFHPRSPYGAAKVYGHYVTMNYRESFGLHASSGILFNHESPVRGAEMVTRKVTLGLARFAHGEHVPVELGNLDARRDWGFAGDYVDGMWRMLQQDEADDYVLATGVTTPIRDFVSFAAEALGLALEWSGTAEAEQAVDRHSGKVAVKVNPKFYRPAEVDLLLGDATKARTRLGWEPKVTVRELADMMARSDYDDWRADAPSR
ncbi:GDP-mannose 4,6-dehydratase [Ancylobacter sp.]|uniref:GDP-mannose 4,6-dehydratase n=1 Tax=Ancylobacter sp. TaxID=1872567 RepID=UPI003BA8AB0A